MEELKAQGNAAVKRGDYVAAVDLYGNALAATSPEQQTDRAPLHGNRSLAYLKLGQHDLALHEAELAVEANPAWHKGHFRLGEARFARREYAEAEAAYKQANTLNNEQDPALLKRLQLAEEARGGFFFRQLLPGRDICKAPTNMIDGQIFPFAIQMKNFIYLVGDAHTREVVVVDAAWDVRGIEAVAAAESVKVVGAVVTHRHFDHVGGVPPPPYDAFGITASGVKEAASLGGGIPVYIHRADVETVLAKTGLEEARVVRMEDQQEIQVGSITIRGIHTPGHTPGSQCLYIERVPGRSEGVLISGDTLFVGSCGRLDLPECDSGAMYDSLQKTLAKLPDSTKVYPGHQYGPPSTTIGREKQQGFLKPTAREEWDKMHGRL